MKKITLFLITLLSFCLLSGQDNGLHQELEQLFTKQITSWVSGDKAGLEPTLSQNFFAIQSGRVFPRDSMLKYVSIRPKTEVADISTNLALDNGHTVYLSCKFTESAPDVSNEGGVLCLASFAREGSNWKIVHIDLEVVPVWEAKEMQDDELTALDKMKCAEEKKLKSTINLTDAFIRFKNNSAEKVEVFWITREGKRRKYAEIAAGEHWDCRTYMTHPWVVIGEDENCKGIYMPKRKAGLAEIN